MAVVQANNLLEDQSQIESRSLSSHESGPYGTFVGVYDGHGGPETSHYINDHFFQHLKRFTSEQQSMSLNMIRKAYQATEEGFLSLVTKQWLMKPQIAAVGSCCLVGVISNGVLYIANLGDSHAVLGRAVKATGEVLAIQFSAEHKMCIESVRQELKALHTDDPQIVVLKHNVWRVKGLIQGLHDRRLSRNKQKHEEFRRSWNKGSKIRRKEEKTVRRSLCCSENYIFAAAKNPARLAAARQQLTRCSKNSSKSRCSENSIFAAARQRRICFALQVNYKYGRFETKKRGLQRKEQENNQTRLGDDSEHKNSEN